MKRLVITAAMLLVTSLNSVKSDKIHKPIRISLSAQSYDPRIFGTWEVKTVVVDSNCRYVSTGEESLSKLNFSLIDGKLTPTWFGHNWNLVDNKMFKLEENDRLLWVRDNSLVKERKFWLAHSEDVFNIESPNYITAQSKIDQYLNGNYVGNYKTVSYLKKF